MRENNLVSTSCMLLLVSVVFVLKFPDDGIPDVSVGV
jgi:hypothetical protein